MMGKKITAIFFLTLASMVMLAFTIMPHHHHQEYICFNNVHCENESPDGQHNHDSAPIHTNHSCIRNLFQTQISRTQSLEHSCCEGHCHHYIMVLFLVPDLSGLSLSEPEKQVLPHSVYRERLHSSVYISDRAGRAPPYFMI